VQRDHQHELETEQQPQEARFLRRDRQEA